KKKADFKRFEKIRKDDFERLHAETADTIARAQSLERDVTHLKNRMGRLTASNIEILQVLFPKCAACNDKKIPGFNAKWWKS
ncbi:hypothetical protein Bhyg_13402, partial [Pseudolycoriella hygida]